MIEAVKTYDDVVSALESFFDHADYLLEKIKNEDDRKERKTLLHEFDRNSYNTHAAATICDYIFGLEDGTTFKNARDMHKARKESEN